MQLTINKCDECGTTSIDCICPRCGRYLKHSTSVEDTEILKLLFKEVTMLHERISNLQKELDDIKIFGVKR